MRATWGIAVGICLQACTLDVPPLLPPGGGGDNPPPVEALGCEAYAGPAGGGPEADGTIESPWGPLAELAGPGGLPDGVSVVCLLDGDHGQPELSGAVWSNVVVKAVNPLQARVSGLTFRGVQGLTIDGVKIDGSTVIDPAADERGRFLVMGDEASEGVTLRNVVVQSADSSSEWTWNDWRDRVRSGIDLRGPSAQVLNSIIRNTYHALSVRGPNARVAGNMIDNFGGDGIRGLGSGSTYEWNVVRDAYIDEYEVQHDDAFQAYKLDGDLRIADVTIRNNRFLLFADPITDFVRSERLVGTLMQGVIITDGYADGWVVENNLIVNSQAHGISLFGGRHCRVQNNTVVRHPAFPTDAGPWIRISDQNKSGHPNFENVIRNNLATMLTPWDYDATSVIEANAELSNPAVELRAPAQGDFRLRPDAPGVNAGVDEALSELDAAGRARRVGAAVDLGAFEVQPEVDPEVDAEVDAEE